MRGDRPAIDVGLLGALIQLVFAVVLGGFLSGITAPTGDAVPRPLVVFLLYAAPGLVALLGARSQRRSLLVAAALPLVPGSILSFSGVTLIFVLPAILMVAGAAGIARPRVSSGASRIDGAGVGVAVSIAALLVAAGWAMLLGFTRDTCSSGANDTASCGSALISIEGIAVGLALQLAALALAAWWARRAPPLTT